MPANKDIEKHILEMHRGYVKDKKWGSFTVFYQAGKVDIIRQIVDRKEIHLTDVKE